MKSPLHDQLVALGGQYSTGGDSEKLGAPDHFGDPIGEYHAARTSAGIVDRSAQSKIELRGRDRAKFLHNLCTNDIKSLAPGYGCEAFITNVQGKIMAYIRVFAGAESIWLETVPGAAPTLLAHFDRYLITEKVELADRTADFAQLMIVGPRACEMVSAAIGSAVLDRHQLEHMEITIAGQTCRLIYSDSLGLPSFELLVPAEHAASVWQRLRESGEPLGLNPIGAQAYDILRIEAGLPIFGIDIDDSNLPQEVGRDRLAISFTKGCYLGQETIARIDALGHVNRHLVGLAVPDVPTPPARGATISSGGKSVGAVSSAANSPALNCAIALGYVRRGFERPGTELIIESPAQPLRAVVHALPFRK
jgi:folate-binding protein YgfZ